MSDTLDLDRRIELERADAARKALEDAALHLEGYSTNDLYHRVLRLAAKLIRNIKNDMRTV
jgi:hypothetical protein